MDKMDKEAILDCWLMFHREHKVSVDRMVCDPNLRSDFLASAKNVCRCDNEEQLLWAVMGLRKGKKLKTQSEAT